MSYTIKNSTHAVGADLSWSDDGTGADQTRYLGVVGTVLYHLIDGNQFRSRATAGSWVQTNYSSLGVENREHTIIATIEAADGVVVFFDNGECTKITTVGYTVCDYRAPMNLIGATGIESGGYYYLTGVEVVDDGTTTTYTHRAYYLDPLLDTQFTEIPLVAVAGVPCYPTLQTAGAADVPVVGVYIYDNHAQDYTLSLQKIDNHTTGVLITVSDETVTRKANKPRRVGDYIVYAGTKGIATYNPDVSAVVVTQETNDVLNNISAFGDYGVSGTVAAYCANTVLYSSDALTWTVYTSTVAPDEVIATITMPPQAATDVDDFLLRITGDDLPPEFFDSVAALGMNKVNFRAEDGAASDIPVRCLKLDTANYEGYFWVLVPTMSSTVDTVIKLIATYDIPLSADPFTGSPYNCVVDMQSRDYRNQVDGTVLSTVGTLNGEFGGGHGAYVTVTDPFDSSVGSYLSVAVTVVDYPAGQFAIGRASGISNQNRASIAVDAYERHMISATGVGSDIFWDKAYKSKGIRQALGYSQTTVERKAWFDGDLKLTDVGYTDLIDRQIVQIGFYFYPYNTGWWLGHLYEARAMNSIPTDDYVFLESCNQNRRLSMTAEVEDESAVLIGKSGSASLERDETLGNWTNEIGTLIDNQATGTPESSLIGTGQLAGGMTTEVKGVQSLDGNALVPITELSAGDIEMTVTWWQTSVFNDSGEKGAVGFRFLDGVGATISEDVATLTYESYNGFTQRTHTVQAPVNTEEVLIVVNLTGDAANNKYALIDGIEVTWIYNG